MTFEIARNWSRNDVWMRELFEFGPANKELWKLGNFRSSWSSSRDWKWNLSKKSEFLTLFVPRSRHFNVFLTLNLKISKQQEAITNFGRISSLFSKHFTTCISFDNLFLNKSTRKTRKHIIYPKEVWTITHQYWKFKFYSSSIFSLQICWLGTMPIKL